MFGKRGKSAQSSRLAARYLDDDVLLSSTHAWTYVVIPNVSYEFLSYGSRELIAEQITTALSTLITNSTDAVDAHLRLVSKPFDVDGWFDVLAGRVAAQSPAPGWPEYQSKMSDHVWSNDFRHKEVFLGICLGPRRGKGSPKVSGSTRADLLDPLKKVTDFVEGALGAEDDTVSPAELAEWRRRADNRKQRR